jgi:hypothetical protein
MPLGKKLGKPPREIATAIVAQLTSHPVGPTSAHRKSPAPALSTAPEEYFPGGPVSPGRARQTASTSRSHHPTHLRPRFRPHVANRCTSARSVPQRSATPSTERPNSWPPRHQRQPHRRLGTQFGMIITGWKIDRDEVLWSHQSELTWLTASSIHSPFTTIANQMWLRSRRQFRI